MIRGMVMVTWFSSGIPYPSHTHTKGVLSNGSISRVPQRDRHQLKLVDRFQNCLQTFLSSIVKGFYQLIKKDISLSTMAMVAS